MTEVEYFLLDKELYRITETNSGYTYVDSWYGFAVCDLKAIKGMWNKVPGLKLYNYIREHGNKLNLEEANLFMEKKLMVEYLKK